MDQQNAQYTVKHVHVFVPVVLCAVTMLIFQIKRIISSEKWFNYVVTFFLKMPKIWVGRTTLNGEKKEDGLIEGKETRLNHYKIHSILLLSVKLSQLLYSFLK